MTNTAAMRLRSAATTRVTVDDSGITDLTPPPNGYVVPFEPSLPPLGVPSTATAEEWDSTSPRSSLGKPQRRHPARTFLVEACAPLESNGDLKHLVQQLKTNRRTELNPKQVATAHQFSKAQ
ncbi:hypothetical protein ColTof3_13895 [Colletotrichum tofieldiae]|nr:hypothetical protein ColTof3_13895 [Colletotrichum tofieldiae]